MPEEVVMGRRVYTPVCKHCGRPIGATPRDPVVHVTAGVFHMRCLTGVDPAKEETSMKRNASKGRKRSRGTSKTDGLRAMREQALGGAPPPTDRNPPQGPPPECESPPAKVQGPKHNIRQRECPACGHSYGRCDNRARKCPDCGVIAVPKRCGGAS